MTLLEVNDRGQGPIITNMTFVDLINCWRNYITNSWTKIVNNVNKIACVHGKLFLKNGVAWSIMLNFSLFQCVLNVNYIMSLNKF